MVGVDEVNDPELEAEILEEANKYGSVKQVNDPRAPPPSGVGVLTSVTWVLFCQVKVFPYQQEARIFLLYEHFPDAEVECAFFFLPLSACHWLIPIVHRKPSPPCTSGTLGAGS